jgi:CBS domain-containing protein
MEDAMKAKMIMTKAPACCTPDTKLQDVARMMIDHDCGAIPVVDDLESVRPIGIITDRDIICRTVAQGKNPLELTVKDCFTNPCVTVEEEASLDYVCGVIEQKQIRRVAVVDERGRCTGIIAQADVAEHASKRQAGEVLRKVSMHTPSPANA